MITLVDGVVGGGKTYWAVREAGRQIAAGGTVYSNVEFVFAGLKRWVAKKFGVAIHRDQVRALPACERVADWWQVIDWGTTECPVLVILDEAHLFWNSRDWAKTGKEQVEMLSFLTQSRKAGVDVIIISQDIGNIDKQFRVLAQIQVKARNLQQNKVPVLGLPLRGVFIYEARELKTGGLLGREWHFRDRGIFACYRTTAFLDSQMQDMARERRTRIVGRRKLSKARMGLLYRLGLKMRDDTGLDGRIGRWLCLRELRKKRANESNHNTGVNRRGDLLRGRQSPPSHERKGDGRGRIEGVGRPVS